MIACAALSLLSVRSCRHCATSTVFTHLKLNNNNNFGWGWSPRRNKTTPYDVRSNKRWIKCEDRKLFFREFLYHAPLLSSKKGIKQDVWICLPSSLPVLYLPSCSHVSLRRCTHIQLSIKKSCHTNSKYMRPHKERHSYNHHLHRD